MNPTVRTFVFVGLLVSILLAMHLLPTMVIGDVELRHVNILSDVLPEVYQQRYGIDVIPVPEPPKPLVARKKKKEATDADSLKAIASTTETPTPDGPAEATADTAADLQHAIADYSEGYAGGMDHFYDCLAQAAERPVRIAYYGDSFVEGDILTADLRQLLQDRFGGSGVGWVDCTDRLNGFRRTVKVKGFGFKDYEVVQHPYSHEAEGIAQRYYVPHNEATTRAQGTRANGHTSAWQKAMLFLRTSGGVNVTTYIDGDSVGTHHVEGAPTVQMLTEQRAAMGKTGYRFTEVGDATFVYGMALEGSHGVVLDNFSMRGSAGYTIAKIPRQTLSDFARLRPYDLIVLHFGLNVASEKSHAANYKAYIRRMQTAVEHLRAAFPQASLLIVSMPDRDQRTDAGIRTMVGVESLVAYQQILAANCHVAYYNLFQAMGGRESMKKLVDQNLAAKDYTHLTHKGGKLLARLIFDALMADYASYHQ